MTERSLDTTYRRIVRSITVVMAIAVSLLVFPSSLLWMVAFWLTAFSMLIGRNRAGWFPLAVCLMVLLIKRPDWSPGLVTLGSTMTGVAVLSLAARDSRWWVGRRRRLAWGVVTLLWVLWVAAVWESQHTIRCERHIPLDPDRPIVCLGDSLTTGLSDDEAYPVYLQQLVSVPVINFGRAGITAQDALTHLPSVLESHPQVVVIELGGHDFLRGYGRAATCESLVQIIKACQEAGASIVLVEIPRGFITDSFSGLERELARTYDLELISDTPIRKLVLRSSTFPILGNLVKPHLSDDGLHPNAAGARFLAEAVCRSFARIHGQEIKANH